MTEQKQKRVKVTIWAANHMHAGQRIKPGTEIEVTEAQAAIIRKQGYDQRPASAGALDAEAQGGAA